MSRPGYAKAKDLVTFRTGKLDSNAADPQGKYPFFTCAQETYRINTYAFDTECVLLAGNNAGGIFPLKFYKGKFNAYQRTYVIESRDTNKLNIKYFYFYLRRLLKAFEQQATGATTKFLTLKILNNIEVPALDIVSQEKLAAILSSYDDLIENNKNRISLLEKMAEEIYREWFVRFRFRGYESVPVIKSIPEGWEMIKLDQAFDYTGGGTPSKAVDRYWQDGNINWFTPSDITSADGVFLERSAEQCTEEGYNSSSARYFLHIP
jgi:type I restriction enzyme S subunit